MSTATDDRIDLNREATLRAKARRLGYRIQKCRVRDSRLPVFGTYGIVDIETGFQAASAEWARGYGLTLGEVEKWIEDRIFSKQEARLRREAQRQGFKLEKSRSRTPRDPLWQTFHIVDPSNDTIVAYGLPAGFGMSIDDVEAWLAEKPE